MANNISDFENVALPPKKVKKEVTHNPTFKIDATSKDSWTLIDFATGQTHIITDPDTDREKLKSLQWDLGFQRTKVISNGGATNPIGNVGILNLGATDFDSIRDAPESGYVTDARKWGKVINPAISGWYNYRTRTHNIESKKEVYLLRTHGHKYAKFKILNYYCVRNEAECSSVMCNRDEAACYTIEYILQHNGEKYFFAASELPMKDATFN